MRYCATIEIDCDRAVVSINSDTYQQFSLSGAQQIQSSRALMISECLMPQIRELMALNSDELKTRNLIALGVLKP